MKKNKHPKLYNTIIILSNGATFNKKWVFLKKNLNLDIDSINHKLWQITNKKNKRLDSIKG